MIDSGVSEDTIYGIVRMWVLSLTGLPDGKVIFDSPGAPRPAGPYVMLNLLSGERIREMGARLYEEPAGGDDAGGEGEGEGEGGGGSQPGPVIERRAQDWEWIFSINLYGQGAFDRARYLVNATRAQGVALLGLHPLVPREASMIRRIPDLVEGEWEGRSQFDLTVTGTVLDGFPVDVVERGDILLVRSPNNEMPVPYETGT